MTLKAQIAVVLAVSMAGAMAGAYVPRHGNPDTTNETPRPQQAFEHQNETDHNAMSLPERQEQEIDSEVEQAKLRNVALLRAQYVSSASDDLEELAQAVEKTELRMARFRTTGYVKADYSAIDEKVQKCKSLIQRNQVVFVRLLEQARLLREGRLQANDVDFSVLVNVQADVTSIGKLLMSIKAHELKLDRNRIPLSVVRRLSEEYDRTGEINFDNL